MFSAEAAGKRVSWVELYFDLISFLLGTLVVAIDPLSFFGAAPASRNARRPDPEPSRYRPDPHAPS
jgi:hypothetical protein